MEWLAIAGNITSQVITTIIILTILVVVGGIIGFILWFRKFKYEVTVQDLTNGGMLTTTSRAKISKERGTGVSYFKLFSDPSQKIPISPKETWTITPKGRIAVAYYKTNNGYSPIDFRRGKDEKLEVFPFTEKQKLMYVNELRKKEQLKRKSLAELMNIIVSNLAVVIIIVSIFAFWGQITQPTLEMADKLVEMKRLDVQEKQIMSDILSGVQRIEAQIGTDVTTPTNDPPQLPN